MTSPELTGGTGFTFEDVVAASYLAALACGTTAPGLASRVVQRVAQQQADFGEPLDDVIVDAASLADGSTMRLSLQVKRSLTISSANSNADFREVVQRSWQTLQKAAFRNHVDRVGAVVGTIADDSFRNFTTVCELARSCETPAHFAQRFAGDGNASLAQRTVLEVVRALVQEISTESLADEGLHRLFSHLILVKFDALHEGSSDEAEVVAGLQRGLAPGQAGRATELWLQLRQLARNGAGRSAEFARATILRQLSGGIRFAGTPALAGDLQALQEGARNWLSQQADNIGGFHVVRDTLRAKLTEEMAAHRLTLVKGLPGTGKTVLLRGLLADYAADGPTLILTANRLTGRSWVEYARAIGLSQVAIEPLLVEIAAAGHGVLFIDGLDRVAPEQRPVVTDLFGQILSNPVLSDWRVVATARDAGIEPLRNWVPPSLLSGPGVGYVDVGNLSDEEASSLADSVPALRPLLTGGDERVRTLARRPFFAAVLARGFSRAGYPAEFAPQSEVGLIDAWWSRGGYDAHAPQALARQLALVELAQRSVSDLGRNVRIRDLTAATQLVLPALEEDGLIQQVRVGHTAQFSHDIFFEWSVYHLLLDQGDDWVTVLTDAGEPPALGRVVELLSQATYLYPERWSRDLKVLASAAVRPQWVRAWLVAPIFSPDFRKQAPAYAAMLFADDHRLLGKLLVWMQAEKTTPNPLVLSGQMGADDLQAAARIRLADALGWPSDFPAWRRLLRWTLDNLASIPDQFLPDLVTLFETWQMFAADFANPVSERVIQQCASWLLKIEDDHQSGRRWRNRDAADAQAHERVPTDLESALRNLVLRAARSYPDVVTAYLAKVATIRRWGKSGFFDVTRYAPLLAQTHSAPLAQVARSHLMQELPDDTAVRWRNEAREQVRRRKELTAIPPAQRTRLDSLALDSPMLPSSFQHHDWQRLSTGGDHQGYFPASPLREPFHSLLTYAAPTGLALVRDLANHATTAWRQLHRHVWRNGTPVPLSLEFPWGRQEFWGTALQYRWFRGHGGPQAVESALMALERWALGQLDAGRPAAEVLQQVLEGHSSIAALGLAIHLALRTGEVSEVTMPLVSSQRLWHLDIQRWVQESEFRTAGLIGFDGRGSDEEHRKAVAHAGAVESRRMELRSLVPRFVLGHDPKLREACRAAIARFPEALEFEYDEEKADEARVAELRRTAELWAEWGRSENYAATRIPGRDDVIGIELRSPRQADPDVQEAQERHAQVTREAELWLWVTKCFESGQWAPGFSPAEAGARAEALSAAISSGEAQSLMPGSSIADGAIAGTAAALLCFAESPECDAWAEATVARYRDEPEPPSDDVVSRAVIPWHPKIFVAHALAARVRSGHADANRLELYRLVAHPLDVVSLTAIEGLAGCWERDQRLAWCGLNLGLRLAQLRRSADAYRTPPELRHAAEESRRSDAFAQAVHEYESSGNLPAWKLPLPAWTRTPDDAEMDRALDDEDGWHRTDDIWISGHAAEVLRRAPVAAIMHSPARDLFVDALEGYIAWTLDSVNPAWRTEGDRSRERESTDLYEWERELGRLIARVAPHLPTADVRVRLLDPILAQSDETAVRLLRPFTTTLTCAEVIDSRTVEAATLELLHVVLERTLQHRDLRRSRYNDGRLGGFDLPELIQSLLFVYIDRADLAARFANGDWSDLLAVMPLVDRLVRQAGWNPYVAKQFTTLCERAGGAYPAETFADQVLAQVVDGHLPSGWKGTLIPASIAGFVQTHADRLHPMAPELARKLLRILDALVDLGDRRSAALQLSESFRGVRLANTD
jgi:hypothetical protein